MSKQVGTKPYQTPRNADLGTMAYQDSNAVNIDGGVIRSDSLKVGESDNISSALTSLRGIGANTYLNIKRVDDERYIDIGHWVSDTQLEVGNANLYIKTQHEYDMYLGTKNTPRVRVSSDGVITLGKDTNSFYTTSNNSGTSVHVTGPVSLGWGLTSESRKGGRHVLGWYQTSPYGSGSYLHIRTSLWGGAGGNTQYIMGGFEIKGYRYVAGSANCHQFIQFHNWNGELPGYSRSNSGDWQPDNIAYVGSNGYVYLRLVNANYVGFTINLFQYPWYPTREISVTDTISSNSLTL